MCDIKRVKVGDKEYMFYNRTEGTRSGFKHITQCFVNDVLKHSHKVCYLNRTWESYHYQTVMKGCIASMINDRQEYINANYKRENNLVRISSKKAKEAINELSNNDAILIELNKVYSEL